MIRTNAERDVTVETLRAILTTTPMTRAEITAHPAWAGNVTSTLTLALQAGLRATPPWIVKTVSDGVARYHLAGGAA